MKNKIAYLIFFLFFLTFFVNAAIVQCKKTPCSWEDLSVTIQNLSGAVVQISFLIALLMSVIGAFLMMFHGPSPKLYSTGVNLIKIAITGYILILLAGIIFDIILDFFQPKFKVVLVKEATAATLTPETYYQPLKKSLMSGLKCGQNATKPIDKLFSCFFEAVNLLKNLALIFLTIAIIASAAYLITTPLFGLKNISKAWKILVWSIIGLVIILIADLIKSQIQRLK